MIRVGHGYDVHAFKEGDHVFLGGVRIECDKGVLAHSDGDVALHALCDALLGAGGLGDIGLHFPDTDNQYCGADSRVLLRIVREKLMEIGSKPINLDVTIITEIPRVSPHIKDMQRCISEDLGLPVDSVNIKATTTENLGFIGRREGIAAHAVAVVLSDGVRS